MPMWIQSSLCPLRLCALNSVFFLSSSILFSHLAFLFLSFFLSFVSHFVFFLLCFICLFLSLLGVAQLGKLAFWLSFPVLVMILAVTEHIG